MKQIITVSREFGSGGRSIAKAAAKKLGFEYYDNELVKLIAKESGLAEDFILENGEYACSTNSFLFNWAINAETTRAGALPISDQLYIAQRRVILSLAEKGGCVILGRCADYILRDREDCLNVFVHAAAPYKADRIVRLYGETDEHPEKRLKDKDDRRRAYYKHYTGENWGDARAYHLCLDSGILGTDLCVELITAAAKGYMP